MEKPYNVFTKMKHFSSAYEIMHQLQLYSSHHAPTSTETIYLYSGTHTVVSDDPQKR